MNTSPVFWRYCANWRREKWRSELTLMEIYLWIQIKRDWPFCIKRKRSCMHLILYFTRNLLFPVAQEIEQNLLLDFSSCVEQLDVSKLEKCYGNYNKSPRFLNIIINNIQFLSLLFFILERKETVSINISIIASISRHKRNVPFLLSNVNPLISDHVIGNRVTNESGDELERSLDTKR